MIFSTRTVIETGPMTPAGRAAWLEETRVEVSKALATKFIKGAEEKGCDIGTVPVLKLLDEMEQEALDQLAYVRELKRRFPV